jgi:hypothetical protein
MPLSTPTFSTTSNNRTNVLGLKPKEEGLVPILLWKQFVRTATNRDWVEGTFSWKSLREKILKKQEKQGWGTQSIDFLSADLLKRYKGESGYSTRNQAKTNVQVPLAQITWYHHISPEQQLSASRTPGCFARKYVKMERHNQK